MYNTVVLNNIVYGLKPPLSESILQHLLLPSEFRLNKKL
jgi:hypothetical protein